MGTCLLITACSQKRGQEHINVLPVRQEHFNRFLALVRYREHVDKPELYFLAITIG